MDFYMMSRFHIMRDYLDYLVIYIVPYRRLYGSRILCVQFTSPTLTRASVCSFKSHL